ncbi:hypothetical protein J3R30DRAFT_1062138 [Lentinula aciculospora]|uniref:Uncharacterized protein n=1 Tax=Lentinula aciculospora TaxID=153920 RepID=A0A9W9A1I4_9AGAR|nr:hypothetical protein J3R30DRAFT_1062138 [Lentinula aciculospora]
MYSARRNAHTSLLRRSGLSTTSSRLKLLHELLCGIQADEDSARTLLQAFDIDIKEECGLKGVNEASFPPQTPSHSVPDIDTLNTLYEMNTPKQSTGFNSFLPPSHSENTFLATPSRIKYFTKLSPSILRQLSRSPSPNDYTLDGSFEAVSASSSFPSISTLEPSNVPELPCEILQASRTNYPLTPPLTARIPCTDPHETHVRMLHSPLDLDVVSTPGFHVENLTFDSVPDIRAYLSSVTPFTASDSRHNKRQRLHDEIRAGGENLASLLQVRDSSRVGEVFPSISVTSDSFDVPSTPVRPSFRNVKIVQKWPRGSINTGRVLQQEFVELLEARAMEEEKQAQELDLMAKKLERLAMQRRQLIALMIAQTKA